MLKHVVHETSTVDGYLLRLREELSGQVPDHKLDEIVAETESHLRERAEAFQELGLGNPEAEAVRTFVETSTYAEEMSDSAVSDRRAERVRAWQRWVTPSLALAGPAALWALWPGIPGEALFVLAAPFVLVLSAVLAFISRRPQTQRILAAGALSAVLAFGYFGFTWVDRGDFAAPRSEAQLQSVTWQNMAMGHQAAVSDIHLARWVFSQDKPQVPPQFLRRGKYLVPPRHRFDGHEETTPSLAEAKRLWKERGLAWMGWMNSYPTRYYAVAENYQKALEGPPFRSGIAGKAARLSIGFSLMALLADLLFARFGEALFWRRRNRKRPKLGGA